MSPSRPTSQPSPYKPRWMRVLIVTIGFVLAGIMLLLGLWQMQVFRSQGERSSEHRAQEPAVALTERAPVGQEVGDVYGRTVTVSGTYQQSHTVRVVAKDGTERRVVGLKLADGRILPVVLGIGKTTPPLPTGVTEARGIFMPAEAGADWATPPGTLGSMRLQLLAQEWEGQLTPGFLTLDDAHAAQLGMTPAVVKLPEGDGAVRNGGYALQWWVFAGFAVAGSLAIARSMKPPVDAAPVESSHDHDGTEALPTN